MYSITLALNPVPSMVICGAQKKSLKQNLTNWVILLDIFYILSEFYIAHYLILGH